MADSEDPSYTPINSGDQEDPQQAGKLRWVTVGLVLVSVVAFAIAANQYTQLPVNGAITNLEGGPAMVHFPQIKQRVPSLPYLDNQDGSNGYLGDIVFSLVPGKEMAGGLYHELAGPTLHYTYTYEEFKFILEGEFHLTDGTGQTVIAKAGDLMHFPCGTRVAFSTPHSALGYFVGQRKHTPPPNSAVQAAIDSNPAMVHYPQIVKNDINRLPYLANTDGSDGYLGDILNSHVHGKSMTGGLYHELAGPALHYTYTYEEFKYIVAGEFHLTDGTGQKVVAKAGDLMHFPNGSKIIFSTPDSALGYFVGRREEAAPLKPR